jgi:Tfp pilus assembly protein PilO
MIRTITPLFSIVVALVIFFFYAKPMFAEIKDTQGKTKQFEQAAEKAVELNATLASLVNKARSYREEDIERLTALVPPEINEVKILADLNEIARSHSMLFGNIDVSDVDDSSPSNQPGTPVATPQKVAYTDLVATTIGFSLIGTYEQFKDFLADIENSLVLLEVANITFDAGEGNLQQYTVSVTAFSLPSIN